MSDMLPASQHAEGPHAVALQTSVALCCRSRSPTQSANRGPCDSSSALLPTRRVRRRSRVVSVSSASRALRRDDSNDGETSRCSPRAVPTASTRLTADIWRRPQVSPAGGTTRTSGGSSMHDRVQLQRLVVNRLHQQQSNYSSSTTSTIYTNHPSPNETAARGHVRNDHVWL